MSSPQSKREMYLRLQEVDWREQVVRPQLLPERASLADPEKQFESL